ncbi:unnamed protein product [Adineta steineri]|uniref:Mixed lineage kinase domain-containing protein n=1 Tax=Adineta steineri TaxID=433720 RepID=A0A813W116_9BILA|nr:unnamed protein product [Adineta steineri]CAF3944301.1 unnamed protein product [Adineta steineri]
MQRNRDREPVSIGLALTVGPPLIGGIFTLAKQIHNTIETYCANQTDCIELNEHIYEVVGCLEHIQSDAQISKQLEQPMLTLQDCLIDCVALLEKFTNASTIGQVLRSRHYKKEFEKLNNQLDKCKNRLLFVIQIRSLPTSQQISHLTTLQLDLDGHHRRKHMDQSRHTPMTPLVKHVVKQSPTIGHHQHQSRHIHHSKNHHHHHQHERHASKVPRSLVKGVNHH